MTSAHEHPISQIDREVWYAVDGYKSAMGGMAIDLDNNVASDEISLVADRRLRLALELADIVQALGIDLPGRGFSFGGVTAVTSPSKVIQPRPDRLIDVISVFPDNTYDQLKQWLRDNH